MFESLLTSQLKALSNPTRFRILQIIAEAGRVGTSDIEAAFSIDNGSLPAMWFHIHALQRAGLLKSTRDGIALRLEIDAAAIESVINSLSKLVINEKEHDVGDAVPAVPEEMRVPEAAVL